nr:MAG TPA_asm: hypothetical protein [Caudoviricetes sp.]
MIKLIDLNDQFKNIDLLKLFLIFSVVGYFCSNN